MPPSGLLGYQACTRYTYRQANTYPRKIKTQENKLLHTNEISFLTAESTVLWSFKEKYPYDF